MRKGINHFLKELGILLFFAFPWFYANILGYYYPVLMHRYAVIVFFIITFSILLCLYISFWVDFYIILFNNILLLYHLKLFESFCASCLIYYA